MSPRAAWRLESLGFAEVYDYAAGKQDWFAAGLPREGNIAHQPRAADVARADVPTCLVGERLGEARARARSAGSDVCLVVNEQRILLGILRSRQLEEGDDGRRVEDVMRPGPSTFRPHIHIEELARFMARHDLDSSPITTADGELVGQLFRSDAEAATRALHEHAPAEHDHDEEP